VVQSSNFPGMRISKKSALGARPFPRGTVSRPEPGARWCSAGYPHSPGYLPAVLSSGRRAHLIAPQSHEIPWTALVKLAICATLYLRFW
jgi:hypothetical protein